jgi:hypothetical protein
MNVAAQFQNVLIFVYRSCAETPLKHMAMTIMFLVEIDRVGRFQALHEATQIALRGFQHHVDVLCEAPRYVESNTVILIFPAISIVCSMVYCT